MECSICANLERAYMTSLSEYIEARSSVGYRVSTKLAAQKNVEMERARYELEEHRSTCTSAVMAPVMMPQRELLTSKLRPLAA